MLSAPKDINTAFKNFYSELYKSEILLDKNKCATYLQDLELPSLTQEDAERLGEPITLTELRGAIAGMKMGKSGMGWDSPRVLSHLLGGVGTVPLSHGS